VAGDCAYRHRDAPNLPRIINGAQSTGSALPRQLTVDLTDLILEPLNPISLASGRHGWCRLGSGLLAVDFRAELRTVGGQVMPAVLRGNLVVSSVHIGSGFVEAPLDDTLVERLRSVPGVQATVGDQARDWQGEAMHQGSNLESGKGVADSCISSIP
jgi:hypothetical protein